ncbi:hypothetical protein GR160_10875 [Flavobacterium sp. Sd200]|uniref:hypothetical protein n=1 Tax=Flavobacterium sp. Sd200 TaxID=2692211 RepID=UPI00136F9965|nr:hypothetical protein [Flavobacterium sp. Sd200]MXN91730.1 hypothetical protein [Flavobacterium sp. Sd200]
MFTNVSWASYLLTVALLCLSWYIYVGIKYYHQELMAFFKGKKTFSKKRTEDLLTGSSANFFIEEPQEPTFEGTVTDLADTLFRDVDYLISRIKQLLTQSIQNNTGQQEITNQLRSYLSDYPAIKKSVFRSQINELIAQECAQGQVFIITEEEADRLW